MDICCCWYLDRKTLVGGWPTLKNMSSSVGMIIHNIWENKTCSKPPTRTRLMCIYIIVIYFDICFCWYLDMWMYLHMTCDFKCLCICWSETFKCAMIVFIDWKIIIQIKNHGSKWEQVYIYPGSASFTGFPQFTRAFSTKRRPHLFQLHW